MKWAKFAFSRSFDQILKATSGMIHGMSKTEQPITATVVPGGGTGQADFSDGQNSGLTFASGLGMGVN